MIRSARTAIAAYRKHIKWTDIAVIVWFIFLAGLALSGHLPMP